MYMATVLMWETLPNLMNCEQFVKIFFQELLYAKILLINLNLPIFLIKFALRHNQ